MQSIKVKRCKYFGTEGVHVSSTIDRLMQCYIVFLMMWRRESKEREKEVVVKQPPHKRNNYLMRQLHNHCMSCYCHATHNILFYVHKLRNYIDLTDDLPDNSLYRLSVESTQDYV
jgi:hypothetical protein